VFKKNVRVCIAIKRKRKMMTFLMTWSIHRRPSRALSPSAPAHAGDLSAASVGDGRMGAGEPEACGSVAARSRYEAEAVCSRHAWPPAPCGSVADGGGGFHGW